MRILCFLLTVVLCLMSRAGANDESSLQLSRTVSKWSFTPCDGGFLCKSCNAKCKHENNLARHVREAHPEEYARVSGQAAVSWRHAPRVWSPWFLLRSTSPLAAVLMAQQA